MFAVTSDAPITAATGMTSRTIPGVLAPLFKALGQLLAVNRAATHTDRVHATVPNLTAVTGYMAWRS